MKTPRPKGLLRHQQIILLLILPQKFKVIESQQPNNTVVYIFAYAEIIANSHGLEGIL